MPHANGERSAYVNGSASAQAFETLVWTPNGARPYIAPEPGAPAPTKPGDRSPAPTTIELMPELESVHTPEPESAVQTEPWIDPEPESTVQTGPGIDPEPGSGLQTEPWIDPEPEPAVQTEPEPAPAVQTEPQPEPTVQTEPQPDPPVHPERHQAPAEAPGLPAPGFLERGRIRRRARYLRRLREVQLRDLGGFIVELQRFARERPELVQAKLNAATQTDAEVRALERSLGAEQPLREIREAGIGGACDNCRAVHGSGDRFCASCGQPLGGRTAARHRDQHAG